jgi:hypothetical protein
VKRCTLHFFLFGSFLLCPIGFLRAELSVGQIYSLTLVDSDGHVFRTDDGHVTEIVLTTPGGLGKAETAGDRTPDYCLGNPAFRMITVVMFKKHSALVRAFLSGIARHRMEEEADRLQRRYHSKKLGRNARLDLHVILDFNGKTVSQLGGLPDTDDFGLLVFSRKGELLKEWDAIPGAKELAAVVK